MIQLCGFDRPQAGSFVPAVQAVSSAAMERGWTAMAVFPTAASGADWVEDFDDAGLGIHFEPPAGKRTMARRLSYLLREHEGPTVLHTHFTTWDVPAVLAGRRRPGTHTFWHVHSTLGNDPRAVARNVIKFSTLGRSTSGILCPAPNIVHSVRRRMAPQDKVRFVPSAVNTDELPMLGPAERAAAREELGIPQEATVLLHFGWHWHLKGGDIFLDVVRRLSDNGTPNLVALERGGGDRAEDEVERAGLAGTVRVVPPVERIQTLFGAADALVATSRSEGMAYTVLESLASGTPVVATAIPGHAYVGEHVAACRTVDQDPAAISEAVRVTLARSENEAEAEALEARDWVDGNLSLEAYSERLMGIYEGALA